MKEQTTEKIKSTILRMPERYRNKMHIYCLENGLSLMDYTIDCVVAGHELLSKQNNIDLKSNEKKAV